MYKIKEGIKCTEVYENVMLFDTEKGEYFELNETGKIMWKAMLNNLNDTVIINEIESKIDAPPEILKEAYKRFTNSLIQKGFIEKVS